MTFTDDELRAMLALLRADTTEFEALLHLAKLDPTRDLRRCDLRNVDLGTADVEKWDFSNADLRGIKRDRVRNWHLAITTGAAMDPDPAQPFDLDEVYRMILRGQAPPAAWAPRITGLDLRSEERSRSDLAKKDFPRPELAYAALRDLAPLQALTNLHSLDLSGTQIADLVPLQALTNLQWLRLDNTQVADLAPLQALTNLQILRLRGTRVIDFTPLAGLKHCTVTMPDGPQMPAPEAARWKPKRKRRPQSSR